MLLFRLHDGKKKPRSVENRLLGITGPMNLCKCQAGWVEERSFKHGVRPNGATSPKQAF